MYLWIDIETLPPELMPPLDSIPVPANYKKPETIAEYQKENQEKAWREMALSSLAGRVCCVSWAVGNQPAVCRGIWDKSERAILTELDEVVQGIAVEEGKVNWAGFNLHSFDLNWIWQRAVKYDLSSLQDAISRDRFPRNVLDVRSLWTGGDNYGKGKLKEIAAFLSMPTIEGMDGGEVLDKFLAEDFDTISKYCRYDVELTRQIAWRMGAGHPPAKYASIHEIYEQLIAA